jgi:hypothetical protein
MKRAGPVFHRALVAVVLLMVSSSVVPGQTASVQASSNPDPGVLNNKLFLPLVDPAATPPQTPQQRVYRNLQDEIYGQLSVYFDGVDTYRNKYLTFMYQQQLLKRDTTQLQDDLDNFDSYIKQGLAAQAAAKFDVGGEPGLDLGGNVTDPGKYNNSIDSALNNDWSARNFLNLAVYQLHSGLLLYQYI